MGGVSREGGVVCANIFVCETTPISAKRTTEEAPTVASTNLANTLVRSFLANVLESIVVMMPIV